MMSELLLHSLINFQNLSFVGLWSLLNWRVFSSRQPSFGHFDVDSVFVNDKFLFLFLFFHSIWSWLHMSEMLCWPSGWPKVSFSRSQCVFRVLTFFTTGRFHFHSSCQPRLTIAGGCLVSGPCRPFASRSPSVVIKAICCSVSCDVVLVASHFHIWLFSFRNWLIGLENKRTWDCFGWSPRSVGLSLGSGAR